jgi:hypothetical protein
MARWADARTRQGSPSRLSSLGIAVPDRLLALADEVTLSTERALHRTLHEERRCCGKMLYYQRQLALWSGSSRPHSGRCRWDNLVVSIRWQVSAIT